MKSKRIWTGLAIALVVAVGVGLPEAASADRGGGSRGGGGFHRGGAAVVKGGGFHGHPGTVFAGHRHFRSSFGVVVGVPLFWGAPWYPYYPPYYYPPYGYPGYGYPPAVVSTSPPVYVEKGAQEGAPGGSDYWYYCEQSQTYYPYVKECPGGWKRVVPQPPEQ